MWRKKRSFFPADASPSFGFFSLPILQISVHQRAPEGIGGVLSLLFTEDLAPVFFSNFKKSAVFRASKTNFEV